HPHPHSFPTRRSSDLLQIADRPQIARPAGCEVVPPRLSLEVARRVSMRQLEHRVERRLWLERLPQIGELPVGDLSRRPRVGLSRSEEHTSELQSLRHL